MFTAGEAGWCAGKPGVVVDDTPLGVLVVEFGEGVASAVHLFKQPGGVDEQGSGGVVSAISGMRQSSRQRRGP